MLRSRLPSQRRSDASSSGRERSVRALETMTAGRGPSARLVALDDGLVGDACPWQ